MAHQEHIDGAESVAQSGVTRRKLIVSGGALAVAGVAVGAVGAGVVSSMGGSAVAAGQSDSGAPGTGDPVMIYLKNRESGQFEVYVGDRHASFANPGMAAQVIQAADRAE